MMPTHTQSLETNIAIFIYAVKYTSLKFGR